MDGYETFFFSFLKFFFGHWKWQLYLYKKRMEIYINLCVCVRETRLLCYFQCLGESEVPWKIESKKSLFVSTWDDPLASARICIHVIQTERKKKFFFSSYFTGTYFAINKWEEAKILISNSIKISSNLRTIFPMDESYYFMRFIDSLYRPNEFLSFPSLIIFLLLLLSILLSIAREEAFIYRLYDRNKFINFFSFLW